MNCIKSYSELMTIRFYEDRYNYLRIGSQVGEETFGFDRYLNQRFYRSREWLRFRDQIIVRDNGCDMGCPEFPIYGTIIVHHINPITPDDLKRNNPIILDPEYAVCVSQRTHEAIHTSNFERINPYLSERTLNDTCPWRNHNA